MTPVDLNFWSKCNVKICRKTEDNILGHPIAFESQIQPTEFAGPEICRHLLYVVVIPLVVTKILLDENQNHYGPYLRNIFSKTELG
jgi:hypothetical protein